VLNILCQILFGRPCGTESNLTWTDLQENRPVEQKLKAIIVTVVVTDIFLNKKLLPEKAFGLVTSVQLLKWRLFLIRKTMAV